MPWSVLLLLPLLMLPLLLMPVFPEFRGSEVLGRRYMSGSADAAAVGRFGECSGDFGLHCSSISGASLSRELHLALMASDHRMLKFAFH